MTGETMPSTVQASVRPGCYFIVLACLVALGELCAGPVFALLGSLLGLAGLWLLVVWLALFNPTVRRQYGFRAIAGSVALGFMLLVPFTVLAMFAHFSLSWHAEQAFAVSGLMASGAAAGGEVVKIGGGRILGALLSVLWSVLLSLAWMLLSMAVLKAGV